MNPSRDEKKEEITLLVLGDGDFSYSLDWATYLAKDQQARQRLCQDETKAVHLIATGLDSKQTLQEKYRDSSFILNKLKAINSKEGQEPQFRVSICHNVNAIQSGPNSDRPQNIPAAQHVSCNKILSFATIFQFPMSHYYCFSAAGVQPSSPSNGVGSAALSIPLSFIPFCCQRVVGPRRQEFLLPSYSS